MQECGRTGVELILDVLPARNLLSNYSDHVVGGPKLQVAEAQGSRRRVPVAPKGSPLMSGWY